MPKNIHHRANTHTLHYKNQHQQNYKRDKKAQSDKRQIARQKVTVIHTNKQKVNVTKHTQATAIGLSLLVFNASVLSDIVLSNPNMPPGIKNNKRLSKNTQAVTKHHSAKFNDYCYQQPQASKIMPVSVAPEQKNYLASNQSNLPKVNNNFQNDLKTPKSNQNSSIKKKSQDKTSDISSVLNAPIGLDNYNQARFYPISYQPPLENNTVREAALFKELLKPFKDLPSLAKEKATLLTILHRVAANVVYAYDMDTTGVEDYFRSAQETLARGGKEIDCEDYAILANFYAMHAQELLYLPQDAKFGIFILPGHALFYYERTLPNEDKPEFYVMDTFTVGALSNSLWWVSAANYLRTLKEYVYNADIYSSFFFNPFNYRSIPRTLVEENFWSFKNSKSKPGKQIFKKNSRIPTSAEWNTRLNNNRQIDDSISADEISLIQYNYIKENGAHSIPEGTEFSKDDIDYIEALEIKNILGYREASNKSAATTITANQAKYLIGSYSQNLDKILTIHDLPAMTENQKEELLKMYSPVLNRKFTHYDVFSYTPCYE
jgi:predicted transglutaminase-like cysteine proteinase